MAVPDNGTAFYYFMNIVQDLLDLGFLRVEVLDGVS